VRICFPISIDDGIKSYVHGHFGTAPLFLIYDTNRLTSSVFANGGQSHEPGRCNPLEIFSGQDFDILVVSGIGNNALLAFMEAGIKVYQSQQPMVGDNIELMKSTGLPEFRITDGCRGGEHYLMGLYESRNNGPRNN
jgi:predicted Fe-Mo cluster-binding NifX family protein